MKVAINRRKMKIHKYEEIKPYILYTVNQWLKEEIRREIRAYLERNKTKAQHMKGKEIQQNQD